jgi:hypothetical protein
MMADSRAETNSVPIKGREKVFKLRILICEDEIVQGR